MLLNRPPAAALDSSPHRLTGPRRTFSYNSPVLFAFAPKVFCQAVTGTLVGMVSDHTGAAVTNAQVTITEQDTGATQNQATNGSGNYEFTYLPPGIYSVSIASPGFETGVTKDVRVPVNTTARVDVTLQAGSVSQTVTVTDRSPCFKQTARM